ncbi:MAG TPA: O-antigen ligase family protein [Gemmatimonadales bacterium]|jgi:O-antigen ligase
MSARPLATPLAQQAGMGTEARTSVATIVVLALAFFAFSLPLEAPELFAYEVTTMTGSLFVLVTLLDPQASYGRVPWPVVCFAMFLFVVLVAFATNGGTYPAGVFSTEALIQTVRLTTWLLLFWACANLLRDPRVYRAALWALIVGCVVRALLPLLGLSQSVSAKGVERVAALNQNPNQSAQVLAMGLLALIGLAYAQHRRGRAVRPLIWAGAGLIAVGIIETGSRGGLVTTAIGVLMFLGSGQTLRVRVRNLLVGGVLLAGLGFLALQSEVMRARVEKTVESGHMSGRDRIWPIAVDMILERPVLGWGPTANKRELAARLNDALHDSRDTHNILLDVLTTAGLLGAIPFLLGTWLCLHAAWGARAGPRGVLPLALVLAILASNMTQNRLASPLFWMVMALGFASKSAWLSDPASLQGTGSARARRM